ncbi:hypothetical protein ACPA9J_10025 [Pseudomonas aeruginosa]
MPGSSASPPTPETPFPTAFSLLILALTPALACSRHPGRTPGRP